MVIKNTRTNHWTQLVPEEQIRFWEDYEAGRATSFLVEPERNRTKRRRGEHSTIHINPQTKNSKKPQSRNNKPAI